MRSVPQAWAERQARPEQPEQPEQPERHLVRMAMAARRLERVPPGQGAGQGAKERAQAKPDPEPERCAGRREAVPLEL